MNHAELQDSIPLLALGGLPADEKARLEKHLEACPSCRALFAEYSFVADELSEQVPALQAPASLEAKVMQQVPKIFTARPAPTQRGQRFANVPRWVYAGAALLAILVLVGLGALLYANQQPKAPSGEQVA